MIVYKRNTYNGRYYKYDLDEYDYFDKMFDETLHDNNVIPQYDRFDTVCGYCGTEFTSRNRLFHHLGFMDINIRKQETEDKCVNEDMDIGDYGVIIEEADGAKEVKRPRKTIYRIRMKKRGKKKKVGKYDLVREMFNNISIQ
jgi:hypothetical protein